MVKQRRLLASLAFALFELAITASVFFAAIGIRERLPWSFLHPEFGGEHVQGLLPVILVIWGPLLWVFGIYRVERTDRAALQVGRVLVVVAAGAILLLAWAFVARDFWKSRFFLAIFLGLNFAALVEARLAATWFWRYARRRGHDRCYVVVLGTGKRARRHAERLESQKGWGIEVAGFVAERPIALDSVGGKPVLGTIDGLERILGARVVDEVHVAVTRGTLDRLDGVLRVCHELGVRTRLLLDYLGELRSHVYLQSFRDAPLLTFSTTPHDELSLLLKRLLDIALSVVLLVAATPVLLIAALVIRLTSRGPVIYRQKRAGMNGRIFTLYKFRTMVEGADRQMEALADGAGRDGATFKLKRDPRITRPGFWLRKFSIDELPQLWNVLRADMSIVGPRPAEPGDIRRYERRHRRRLSMRPGLTCIWQVSGRNLLNFNRRVEMDLEYIDNWSLALDVKIILKTIPAVLSSRGAY